jgi:Cu/Ag efflux protein CusF
VVCRPGGGGRAAVTISRIPPEESNVTLSRAVATLAVATFVAYAPMTWAQTSPPATPAPKTSAEAPPAQKKPGVGEARAIKLHGTVAAVDKEGKTITLKGSKGRTVTLDVHDPTKLEAVKVGDPVVATYYEAVAVQVKPAGSATPSVTVQEGRAGSKPGDNPAGVIAREVTLVGTITAVNPKAPSVTIKGPKGRTETVKVKDAKNLANVKVGDMVELTYAQAFAVALDKAAKH